MHGFGNLLTYKTCFCFKMVYYKYNNVQVSSLKKTVSFLLYLETFANALQWYRPIILWIISYEKLTQHQIFININVYVNIGKAVTNNTNLAKFLRTGAADNDIHYFSRNMRL